MTNLETRLERALAADAAPARDPMFRVQILLLREQAAFRRKLLISVVAVLCVAILAPVVMGAASELVGARAEPLAAIATAAAALAAFLAVAYAGQLPPLGSLVSAWRARASLTLGARPARGFWY